MTLLLPGAAAVGYAQNQMAAAANFADPEPQIVRLSYVQGDVRVSRGKEAKKKTRADWEQAAIDLPLESGYSLVTGDGRAEIEFEDSSVIYLAENSVLVFNDLYTSNGSPQTNIALLSGTMSLNVKPMDAAETFLVQTPAMRFTVPYPHHNFVRLSSYLDGFTVTPLGGAVSANEAVPAGQLPVGHSVTYLNGKPTMSNKSDDASAFVDFDRWVLGRSADRTTAIAETMKAAGLNQPVPGLGQLKGQGHFFPCPPYGTCWEPTNGWAGQQMTASEKAAAARQTVSVAALAKGGPNQVGSGPQVTGNQYTTDIFPCSPFGMYGSYQYDPLTGRPLMGSSFGLSMYGFGGYGSYQWAVCHSGSWIQNNGRYAWVPGVKHHPYSPVHWVKSGNAVGFVPIHPGDTTGKPPVNLKNGIVHPVDSHGSKMELLSYSGTNHVKVLDSAPREFRQNSVVPLQRADTPHADAHVLRATGGDDKAARSTPITFDSKRQSFMVSQPTSPNAAAGNSMRMEPIGGRNSSVQVHANSGGGGSEMRAPSGNPGGGGNYSRGGPAPSGGFSGGSMSHSSPAPASAPVSMPAPAPAAPAAVSGGGRAK